MVRNSAENVFNPATEGIFSHQPKDGVRIFLPARDLDFENLDCPVAERIPSRFRNTVQIVPRDVHAYQRNAAKIVPNRRKVESPALRSKAANLPQARRQMRITLKARPFRWQTEIPYCGNHYRKGQGLAEQFALFANLGSACKFRFRRPAGEKWERFTLNAEPRSLYLMSGASRQVWEHSIPAVEAPRYSITFRTMVERKS